MSYKLGQPQPESKAEAIFQILWDEARKYFPTETAKAEDYVMRQAARYGLHYAKERTVEFLQNPLLWLGIGGLAAFLLKR